MRARRSAPGASLAGSMILAALGAGCTPAAGGDDEAGATVGDGESGTTDTGESGTTDTGDTGDDGPIPVWGCDPIRRLDGLAPADLDDSGVGVELAADGVHLFQCREGAGLRVWSLGADTLTPVAELELARPGCKWAELSHDGTRLAVSDPGDFGEPGFVQLIDVGDPAAPIAGPSLVEGRPEGLAFAPDDAALLVAARDAGLRVHASEDLAALPGFADAGSDSFAILADPAAPGSYWIAEGIHGVRAVDWSMAGLEAPAPIPGSAVELAGVSQDLGLAGEGGQLLAATLGGVVAIERETGEIASLATTPGVALRITPDPDGPAEGGGARVWVADWSGLRALDIPEAGAPTLVAHQGEIGGPTGGLFGVRDLALLDGQRLVSSGLRGLELWALDSSCEAPSLVSERRRLHYTPDRDARVLNLSNEGRAPLEVLDIRSDDPSVTALPSSFTLEPGAIQAVEVAIEHGEERISELEIRAVVPDPEPELETRRLELCADCPGMPVGSPAPPLIHIDTTGELWSRERMAGEVVLLAYFATWCGTCNEDLPLFETELWQAYLGAGGRVLGLANQAPELVVEWALDRGLSYPILLQQDSYERWQEPEGDVYSLDVLLDQRGQTQAIAHGGDIADWVALFESLL